jgi:hypothetical protein
MNIYGRTRPERLKNAAEALAGILEDSGKGDDDAGEGSK